MRQELSERLAILEQDQAETKAQLRRCEVETMEATYAWKQSLSDQEKATADLQRLQQNLLAVKTTIDQLSLSVEQHRTALSQARSGASEAKKARVDC